MRNMLLALLVGSLLIGCSVQDEEPKYEPEVVKEENLVDEPEEVEGRFYWDVRPELDDRLHGFHDRNVSLTTEEQNFIDDVLTFHERYGAHHSFEEMIASLQNVHDVEMPVILYHHIWGYEEWLHFADWHQINFEFPDFEGLDEFRVRPFRRLQSWQVEVVPAGAALNELFNISLSDTERPALLVVIYYVEAEQQLFDSLHTSAYVMWTGMPFELVDTILSLAEPVLVESSDVDGVLIEIFRWERPEPILSSQYPWLEATFENGRLVDLRTNITSRG